MSIDPIFFWSVISVTLILTFFLIKKTNKKGCLSFGLIGLLILVTNLLTILSWSFMYNCSNDLYIIATSSHNYSGKVVNFSTKQHYDSEKNTYYNMYTPIIEFTTKSGKVLKKALDYNTSELEIGDVYKINYNAATGNIIVIGFVMIFKLLAAYIFSFIFTTLFLGLTFYIIGYNMERFETIFSKICFYFFIPTLFLGISILILYGVLYDNSIPSWVRILLVPSFIFLMIRMFKYFKMITSNHQIEITSYIGSNKSKGK